MGGAILLIHTEQPVREAARERLERSGHSVREAGELAGAWPTLSAVRPDLILLPWSTLKISREWLARLRENGATRHSRVIVWAPHSEVHDAVNALELGADDCLALPFAPAELVARVNACLRRPASMPRSDLLAAGPIALDRAVHSLTVQGRQVDLAPAEFRLLAFFLENQGRVFGRDELLRRAWSKNVNAGHRTVDVHVRRLRQLLEPFGCEHYIQTIRGFGYRFAPLGRDGRQVSGAHALDQPGRL